RAAALKEDAGNPPEPGLAQELASLFLDLWRAVAGERLPAGVARSISDARRGMGTIRGWSRQCASAHEAALDMADTPFQTVRTAPCPPHQGETTSPPSGSPGSPAAPLAGCPPGLEEEFAWLAGRFRERLGDVFRATSRLPPMSELPGEMKFER